jgi:hypothetical protein
MDVKQVLAATPMLRRAWRVMPPWLRWPVVALAFVVWLVRRGGDDEQPPSESASGESASGEESGSEPPAA